MSTEDAGSASPAATDAPPETVPASPLASAAGPAPTVITVYPNGPLLVRGPFTLQGPDQQPIDPHRKVVALCRCGLSRIKPLCDGTHVHGSRSGDAPAAASKPTDTNPEGSPACT